MSNVPAGAYSIFAKTIIDPGGGGSTVVCTVDAGGTTDSAEVDRTSALTFSLSVGVSHTFAATGSIVFRCTSTAATTARLTKIIAVKVDSATRTAVTG